MRVLLLCNPTATTTSPALVGLIARALRGDADVEVTATKRRDHARHLAAGAAHEGYDAVVVLGGDGTVNEVVQGLAGTGVRLGVIPGGSTNVFARILGFSRDAVDATNALRASLRAGAQRKVTLGRVAGRLFTFHAGFGFDAEIVRLVEARTGLKRRLGQAAFLYSGLLARYGAYDRRVAMRVQVRGCEPADDVQTLAACNADPFTFVGHRPLRLCPEADLDGQLELLGSTSLSTSALLRLLRTALTHGDVAALSFTRAWHDVAEAEITADRPVPLQADGDSLGHHQRVTVESRPHALTVIPAPALPPPVGAAATDPRGRG